MAGTGQHAALDDAEAVRALRRPGSLPSMSGAGDSSIPPPPPPPSSMGDRTTPTDSYLIERVNGAHARSKQALELAKQASSGITRLEQAFGQSPDPATGKPGSGMLGVLSELTSQFKAEREERAKSRQAWSNIGKGVAIALGAVGTIFGILAKVFRW